MSQEKLESLTPRLEDLKKEQREDPLKAARINHLSAGLAVYNISKTKLQGTSRIDLSDEVMRDAIANEAFGRCADY